MAQKPIVIKNPEEETSIKEPNIEDYPVRESESRIFPKHEPTTDFNHFTKPEFVQKRVRFKNEDTSKTINQLPPEKNSETKYIDVKIPGVRAKGNTRKLNATQKWAVNLGTLNLRRSVNRYSSIFSHEYQFTDTGLVRLHLKEGEELTQADYEKMPKTWIIDLNSNLE